MHAQTNKPKPEKSKPIEHKPGKQQDDNIDDLGRPINEPNGKPVDQPV